MRFPKAYCVSLVGMPSITHTRRFSQLTHGTQLSVPRLPHQMSSVAYLPACIGTRVSFSARSRKSHHSGLLLNPQMES